MFTVTLSVRSLLFALGLVGLVLLANTSQAEVYPVNTNTDIHVFPGPGVTTISLRSALDSANDRVGLDMIVLPEGTYTLTIPGRGENENWSGDLDILDPVIIQGAGPDKTIIDGKAIDRVFDLLSDGFSPKFFVFMSNLTIQNGMVNNVEAPRGGGGIYSNQTLSLSNVVIKNNTVEGGVPGGGLDNNHNLTLNKVVVRDNTVVATGEPSNWIGGGIHNGGTLEITETKVSGNRADRGGGLFNGGLGTATIERSLFTENRARAGSGISAYGILNLVNTTIHANMFDGIDGYCALDVDGTAIVSCCTITDNHSSREDLGCLCASYSGSLTLRSTILSGNKTPGITSSRNCTFHFPPTSATYNLEDANTCTFSPATNLINTDPKLGPLQDNGGPTQTRALAADSPAIDYVRINTGVTVDQRGRTRPVGPWADIGAYEYESPICFPVRSPDGKTAIICL